MLHWKVKRKSREHNNLCKKKTSLIGSNDPTKGVTNDTKMVKWHSKRVQLCSRSHTTLLVGSCVPFKGVILNIHECDYTPKGVTWLPFSFQCKHMLDTRSFVHGGFLISSTPVNYMFTDNCNYHSDIYILTILCDVYHTKSATLPWFHYSCWKAVSQTLVCCIQYRRWYNVKRMWRM